MKTATEKYNDFVIVHGSDVTKFESKQVTEYLELVKAWKKETSGSASEDDQKKYEEICKAHQLAPSPLFSGFVYTEKPGKKMEGELKGKIVQIVAGVKYSKDGRNHQLTAYIKPTEIDKSPTVVEEVQLDKIKILSLI